MQTERKPWQNYFPDLDQEHRLFLRVLDRERDAPNQSTIALLGELLEIHHRKEEELLFPLLFGSPALEAGGPKCTTFFTPRVMGSVDWPEAFQALRGSLRDRFAEKKPSPLLEQALERGSMLRIPLEDHALGAVARQEMLALRDSAALPSLFAKFSAFLRDHIQREDECLFPLFAKELSLEQLEAYREKARAADERLGAARLMKALAATHGSAAV